MSYEKHTWETGETITAEKLNNLENGVASSGGSESSFVINITPKLLFSCNIPVSDYSALPMEYGINLWEFTHPGNSGTPAFNVIFDGVLYSYLSWWDDSDGLEIYKIYLDYGESSDRTYLEYYSNTGKYKLYINGVFTPMGEEEYRAHTFQAFYPNVFEADKTFEATLNQINSGNYNIIVCNGSSADANSYFKNVCYFDNCFIDEIDEESSEICFRSLDGTSVLSFTPNDLITVSYND